MIRYTLKCSNDHSFDSWFKSADSFDMLKAAGQMSCPVCGSETVSKALMAPPVSTARKSAAPDAETHVQQEPSDITPDTTPDAIPTPLSAPANDTERAIEAMRKHVESTSDYVGLEFTKQARAMHDGDAPARSIYGEANLADAKALLEDGISVMPLPFTPKRNTN
ncbi:DUF1178 family protein [Celeribacter sp.]|uniref:DUF1178 family protein n=1 Tax=Celeribacter sp. TaxID=1890673 RepID=UPI003A9280C9